MPLAFLLALQAAGAAPAASPHPSGILELDFDLARLHASGRDLPGRDCGRADAATITVCGRRSGGGAYPMAEMARIFEPRRLVAETGIAGSVTGNVHVESAPMDRGQVSNRVMVGLRLPF